ncbi:MAG TPA: glutamate formimidoyltransferase [Thermoanaerobaculia bacterium]|nr:glutamate formimidoyltransferase [Thermoanaerobaculia bacterium]
MIEAVPNVSEGRDRTLIESIADSIRAVTGVALLNVSSDPDHNRSVFTYVSSDAAAMEKATLALYERAVGSIDLRHHRGAHPRAGAVDVCPFVPLGETTMEECVALAERIGEQVARRFDLPVYLYEYAARTEARRELPAIRSGGFENFQEKIVDPVWAPDFGPSRTHASAGVTIVGARLPLIAFNVQLTTDRIDIADKVARAVRGISGGLRWVRALAIPLPSRGIVQVSMNLLDYRKTPIHRAFTLVREEAARHGVAIASAELVGLVPEDALFAAAEWFLRLENFERSAVLERRIEEVTATSHMALP